VSAMQINFRIRMTQVQFIKIIFDKYLFF